MQWAPGEEAKSGLRALPFNGDDVGGEMRLVEKSGVGHAPSGLALVMRHDARLG